MTPFFRSDAVEIIHGDCMQILPAFPAGSFDMLIADPPYCSGGNSKSERKHEAHLRHRPQ